MGVTSGMALERLRTLLKSKNHAFIYHCYNHYFCPVGFEREPSSQERIYNHNYTYSNTTSTTTTTTTTSITNTSTIPTDPDLFIEWILVAETSRKYPAFHCFKWDDIDRDLCSRSPEYVNIRKLERGVQKRGTKTTTAAAAASQANTTTTENPELEAIAINLVHPDDSAPKRQQRQRVRRDGQNLHCLMMFQSFDSSPWQVPLSSSDSSDHVNLKAEDLNIIINNDDYDDEDESSSSSSSSSDIGRQD